MPSKKGNKVAVVNKGGRPSKYEAVFAKQVYDLALLGATDVNLAAFFDVTIDTIHGWKHKHPGFLNALKRGKMVADSQVAKRLFQRAMGYTVKEDKIFNHNGKPLVVPTDKHYPPDVTAAIFWLKNRMKEQWRDRQEIGGQLGISRQLDQLSDEDFSKMVVGIAEHLQNK